MVNKAITPGEITELIRKQIDIDKDLDRWSEIYVAQFSDRIVQHFYMNELEDIIQEKLVDGCCSCIKGKGTGYALKLLKKFLLDTAYHGVPFLGKISYPYGYQKPNRNTIIRINHKAKTIKYEDKSNLLAKVNSQIGTLKNYNCTKLISNYVQLLPYETKKIINYDCDRMKFY